MPLTAGGKLKIVASANLGALGAKEGSPAEYTWVLPSIAPQLLPWLVILALLALKPNRTAAAWLIWLPLGFAGVPTLIPPDLASGLDLFLDVIMALVFGLAAVWLTSNYLPQSHRLLTFFCVLFMLAGFSVLAFVAKQGLSLLDIEALQIGILLGVGVLVSTVGLSLTGWTCRHRWRAIGIYPWLCLLLIAIWFLIATPFFVFASISSGGQIPWSEFFVPVLCVAAGNFVLLLPFLILSSASSFFSERRKALLNVKLEAPPIIADAGSSN